MCLEKLDYALKIPNENLKNSPKFRPNFITYTKNKTRDIEKYRDRKNGNTKKQRQRKIDK